jgi:hypothetical protein
MGVSPFRLSPSYVTWGPPPVSARGCRCLLLLVRSLMTALNPRLALALLFADDAQRRRRGPWLLRGTDPRAAPGPCLGLSRGTHLPASCNLFLLLCPAEHIYYSPSCGAWAGVGPGGWEPDLPTEAPDVWGPAGHAGLHVWWVPVI